VVQPVHWALVALAALAMPPVVVAAAIMAAAAAASTGAAVVVARPTPILSCALVSRIRKVPIPRAMATFPLHPFHLQ
jgi:hypothetical protein